MPLEWILAKYNYWISATLMLIGFYTMISKKNFIKKIIGMNIFQTAIILFYISIAEVKDGVAPILLEEGLGHAGAASEVIYVNPLPHVLMLTAIVVGVSTTAVALSLIMKIHKEYGTFEEDDIVEVH
ncbi:MAG: cation:proton antiporter subunit C [Candidatus Altiarchaeales archaeon]|nr:cation:proton antiporter subunit C [Candidatus Altiarchaeales archaeon]